MTDQADAVDADQTEYDAALDLMRAGSQHEAQVRLNALIDKYKAAPDTIRPEIAANAMCTLACSERDNGQVEDALNSFMLTSLTFGYGKNDEARYVAGIADLLASKLYCEQGRPQVAHALLDNMSLRIMMEDNPKFRELFNEAMASKNALERTNGFESGVGIGMDRIDIGRDDRLFDPVKPLADDDGPDLGPIELAQTLPPPPMPVLFDTPEPPPPAPEPEAADDNYRYQKIESTFKRALHAWELSADALVVTRQGQSFSIPYTQMTRLTLRFAPTRFKKRRYTMRVQARGGAGAEIDNMSFVGISNFEDRSFDYALLVHGLGLKIRHAGSACEVVGGVSWPYYLLMAAVSAFGLLVVLLTFLLGGPIGILIKLVLVVLYVPRLVRWFKFNRPAHGTPTAFPPGTVPPLVP
jgi:hypothetical protein